MSGNDVDTQAEAEQDAAAAAAQEIAQQEAMAAAQQEALAAAQDLAAEDDGQGLAELAADEGDPFENEVEDIDDQDDAEEDTADADTDAPVDESDSDTAQEEVTQEEAAQEDQVKDTAPAPVNEDAFIPDEDEIAQTQPEPVSDSDSASDSGAASDSDTASKTNTRPDTQAASAAVARSGASSQARADALTSMSSAEFRRRLRDEQVKHSGGVSADEGHLVRSQLDQARRRGAQLGLIDEAALKQFDDEMAYNDATLDEDQRSAYGPGSPMYEEAKRLGYIVEGDRTSTASSMRIRDAQDVRREAEERLRFHHYWQQQAARDYLSRAKAVMQAEDTDNGVGAGFSQLGRLLTDLTNGDGVDDATVEAYIAAQTESVLDDAASEDVVLENTALEETAPENTAPEETTPSEQKDVKPVSDLDLTADIEAYCREQERELKARIEARKRELEAAALNAVNTVVDEERGAETTLSTETTQSAEEERPSMDEVIDAAVVRDGIDRTQTVQSVEQEHIEKKEDTPVTIQEFVEAWEQFSAVERRIALRRTGLVNADEMEEVYTELQETVRERTDERDRYHEECNQLKADLEYETGVRRDAEREVVQLRNSVSARGPRG